MTPNTSPLLFSLFSRYARRYVGRSFNAVRIADDGKPPAIDSDSPIVVYLNHASWWDPMIALLLASHFWPRRNHFAPIDSAALDRYRFLSRLGFFPVEQNSFRGAARFARNAREILSKPSSALWITPQGTFADPRLRPALFRPGIGHLADSAENTVFVPLAIEYPFWQERFPEALCRFGQPLRKPTLDALEQSLQSTQDALAALAIEQYPQHFESIIIGRAGVNWIYDAWRGLRARWAGGAFSARHGESPI